MVKEPEGNASSLITPFVRLRAASENLVQSMLLQRFVPGKCAQ